MNRNRGNLHPTAGDTETIFIQVSKLDDFKNKKPGGRSNDTLTFTVDDSFQYGQKEENKDQFLVYHDESNKQYQVLHVLPWSKVF